MNNLPDLVSFVNDLTDMRFTPAMNARIHDLMDRNNEGTLSPSERQELESLVDWSEQISLVRAKALQFMGKKPE